MEQIFVADDFVRTPNKSICTTMDYSNDKYSNPFVLSSRRETGDEAVIVGVGWP